ncbi:hypothetical protein ACFV6F_22640 [Kitasatospora phosalacinea]|uniref:hypothetical protein n=1 Tax=Kitasatospora phosalacinea TaxID=2065 RepID=UPI0036489078
MLTALWSGLGGKVADRWAVLLVSPALAFWLGGGLAWALGRSGPDSHEAWWRRLGGVWTRSLGTLPPATQAVAVVVGLLAVAASARLAEALTFGVLRTLEGYWPHWAGPARTALTSLRAGRIDRRTARWRELARRRDQLTPPEYAEYTALNAWRTSVPPAPRDRMPTALGDVLRAAESRPRHRYGLDAVVCWPRLWLTMPDQARTEVATARARMDEGARLWLWSLLFALWTVFSWWALPVAAVGMLVGYRMALAAAAGYGQLLQTCFDLYRGSLYEGLGRSQPADPVQEFTAGRSLTALLERGPDLAPATGGTP